VGKITVALAVCAHLGRAALRVDGDDRYSESKLAGWFDSPLVLRRGYGEESFFAGPPVQAMRAGCVLLINELNRMPESVQNVLSQALDEGRNMCRTSARYEPPMAFKWWPRRTRSNTWPPARQPD
jgi:MoxR-like ATPase